MQVKIEFSFVFHSQPCSVSGFILGRQVERTINKSGRTQDVAVLAGGGALTSQVRVGPPRHVPGGTGGQQAALQGDVAVLVCSRDDGGKRGAGRDVGPPAGRPRRGLQSEPPPPRPPSAHALWRLQLHTFKCGFPGGTFVLERQGGLSLSV